jgi:hypothetical protein
MTRADLAMMIPVLAIFCAMLAIVGWVVATWLRGRGADAEIVDRQSARLRTLGAENAGLRDELIDVRDRLASLERLVTDRSVHFDPTQSLRGSGSR